MGRVNTVMMLIAVGALLGVPMAQAGNTINFGVGIASPIGDLNEYWTDGISVGGTYVMEVSPSLGLGFDASYNKLSLDDTKTITKLGLSTATTTIAGGAATIFNAAAELRLKAGSMDTAMFWGSLGGGFMVLGMEDLIITEGSTSVALIAESATKLGGYLGAGAAMPLNPTLRVGLEARYMMYTVGDSEGFTEIEDSRNFLTLRAVVVLGM